MTKDEQLIVLRGRLERYRSTPYSELIKMVGNQQPETDSHGDRKDQDFYQTEVEVVYDPESVVVESETFPVGLLGMNFQSGDAGDWSAKALSRGEYSLLPPRKSSLAGRCDVLFRSGTSRCLAPVRNRVVLSRATAAITIAPRQPSDPVRLP